MDDIRGLKDNSDESDVTILGYRLSGREERDLIADLSLHTLFAILLHKYYFEGQRFFGVGSETLHGYLETMWSKLIAGGKFFFLEERIFQFTLIQEHTITPQFSVGVPYV